MSKYRSLFEIIGPVMVGPSSSHTAGAVRIGQIARNIFGGQARKAIITFYGSFAHTYQGHGTDVAIIAGILGMETFDSQIPSAYQVAAREHLELEIKENFEPVKYPNTARVELFGEDKRKTVSVVGISVGGGTIQIIEINGFACHITGEDPAVLVFHHDVKGRIAAVTNVVADHEINVSHMEVSRTEKGKVALMIFQTDEEIAAKYQLCPHELSLDISDFCDLVIGDYNHIFDPRSALKHILNQAEETCALLIDEAHNLPARAREMFSAHISTANIMKALTILRYPDFHFFVKYTSLLETLAQIMQRLCDMTIAFQTQKKANANALFSCEEDKWLIDENFIGVRRKPTRLLGLLQQVNREFRAFFNEEKIFEGRQEVLQLWFDFLFFTEVADLYFDDAYLTALKLEQNGEVHCYLLALDAAKQITAVYQEKHPIVFFSATMSPLFYYHHLLNKKYREKPSETISFASPFDRRRRLLGSLVAYSVRYKDRQETLPFILQFILRACQKKTGNYLIFAPSFEYLAQIHRTLRTYPARPDEKIIYQKQQMSRQEKQTFLAHFEQFGRRTLIGFAVLGSHFNEGIDLAGERLSGVFVIGTGLPQISPERELMTQYYAEQYQAGRAFGYQYPGFNRVQQAIGRLIRSEQDSGIAILIDDRYANQEWQHIYPDDWHVKCYQEADDLLRDIEIFWQDHFD